MTIQPLPHLGTNLALEIANCKQTIQMGIEMANVCKITLLLLALLFVLSNAKADRQANEKGFVDVDGTSDTLHSSYILQ